jgi:predicted RNA binding protein YcfA (HicA-like mRNA interferase family)
MKIPRDINATDLIKALKPLGYEITRQIGSHIRLTTTQNGQHHLTVPNRNPIKIGTLSSILSDVASHFKTSKEDIIRRIF